MGTLLDLLAFLGSIVGAWTYFRTAPRLRKELRARDLELADLWTAYVGVISAGHPSRRALDLPPEILAVEPELDRLLELFNLADADCQMCDGLGRLGILEVGPLPCPCTGERRS